MKKYVLSTAVAVVAIAGAMGSAAARDQIQIVGSSTVFPFTTAVAEKLGQGGKFKTPVVESTGTGGGMKLFCGGVGETTPDFTNASRAIKDAELETCKANGVTPVEIKVGFDGIVLANSKAGAVVGSDEGADLQGSRQERGRRRQGRCEPLCQLVGHRCVAAGDQDRGARPAADLRHARRLRRARHGRRLPGRGEGRERKGLRRNPRRRRLCRSRRERQPDRSEARGQPGRVRHLRLLLPRPERRQAAGPQDRRRRADLREHRSTASTASPARSSSMPRRSMSA